MINDGYKGKIWIKFTNLIIVKTMRKTIIINLKLKYIYKISNN